MKLTVCGRFLSIITVFILSAFLLASLFGCDSSSTSSNGLSNPTQPTLHIKAANPSSGSEDAMVHINYSVDNEESGEKISSSDIAVVIGGQEIEPEDANDERLSFRVPAGLEGDVSMFLRADSIESNTLRFTVSNSVSVVAPEPSDIVTTDDGSKIAVNLVMIFVAEGFDMDKVAKDAALSENGEVVGGIDPLRARQLRLLTESLDQLEKAIDRLIARDDIDDAALEIVYEPDELIINWADDPDLDGQRASNNVEKGANAYINAVHPTRNEAVRPYFRAIGVFEAGVHFSLDDYDGYSTGGGSSSGGISLYSPDNADARHGSNVLGIIAAELGDGRASGLLRALGEHNAHGGFNIRVGNSELTTSHGFLAELVLALEMGARLFNMSAGVHKCENFDEDDVCVAGTLQSSGDIVTDNTFNERTFNNWRSQYDRAVSMMERDYPGAILVVSAGNGNTDAGDQDWRLFSAHDSNQVISIGAHTNDSMPTRESFSNYGERVDIAAAGTVQASYSAGSTRGTSFATPLVTATIAAMRSIEPDLTPDDVSSILRQTALPIENNAVTLLDENGNEIGETVFTRALTAEEVGEDAERIGYGARLNVEGAIEEAIARRGARTRRTGDPLSVGISGDETVDRIVNVAIPDEGAVFDRVDIMFLVDVSGSYRSSIAQFKTQAVDLVNAFEASGTNVHTGIASFSDFPVSPWGRSYAEDYAYHLNQQLTANAEDTIAAINELELLNGADTPESQLEALYQLATGDGRMVEDYPDANIESAITGWREGSLRIIFLATDANFHNPEDTTNVYTQDYPGSSWDQTINALHARSISVYGLERGYEVPDVRDIVEETDGQLFQLDFDSSDIVDAVEEALETAAEDLDLALKPNGDFANLIRDIRPEVFENVQRGEMVTFTVTLDRGETGPGEHVFSFRLEVVGDETVVIKEIPIIVEID